MKARRPAAGPLGLSVPQFAYMEVEVAKPTEV